MRGRIARNRIWKLIESQHGVISRRQLLALGISMKTVDRRIATGRLHVVWRGVYAVGRPRLSRSGWWSAAVLACGEGAVLSHTSAAELWGIRKPNIVNEEEVDRPATIHVSVPADRTRRLAGIVAHRRIAIGLRDRTRSNGIPITSPARTLIDLAIVLQPSQLEAAVNAADKLDLIDPDALRDEVDKHQGMDGVAGLRRILDRRTFSLTESELERRFVPLARRAGLPLPMTQQRVNGFRVDFFWPDLKLVVETDGLRYHRTPSQQSKDRIRDQAHVAAGFVVLRFTHAQVVFNPDQVIKTLREVARTVSVD